MLGRTLTSFAATLLWYTTGEQDFRSGAMTTLHRGDGRAAVASASGHDEREVVAMLVGAEGVLENKLLSMLEKYDVVLVEAEAGLGAWQ
jgi:hypothetical protein